LPSEFPDRNWFRRTRVLLIDFESGLAGIEAAKTAKQHNIPVVIDVERNEPHVVEAMSVSSHIIVSEEFASGYTSSDDIAEMLTALRRDPEQVVIVTRGENGCVGSSKEREFELPAFAVDVVDTTGCGDTFHGAFALAIARGQPVISAARSSIVCDATGWPGWNSKGPTVGAVFEETLTLILLGEPNESCVNVLITDSCSSRWQMVFTTGYL
jgi:sugar/nucleoside kinase (ribokinase family)